MKERPILFSGEMVKAILDGKKTMTRRVVKPQPKIKGGCFDHGHWSLHQDKDGRPSLSDDFRNDCGTCGPCEGKLIGAWIYLGRGCDGYHHDLTEPIFCPYGQPGDRLWVRENYTRCGCGKCLEAWPKQGPHGVLYEATYHGPSGIAVRPSIFMPRWASRITLEITAVRVERVQDISEMDTCEEGRGLNETIDPVTRPGAAWFRALWDSLNAKRGYGWDVNPWVWVIKFNTIEGLHRQSVEKGE